MNPLLARHPAFFEMIGQFSKGEATPRAYLELCIASMLRAEPQVQAFTCLDLDGARKLADQATQRYRDGRPLSPVDGMPIGIKDIIATAAMPTQMNSPMYQGHYPKGDAAAVRAIYQGGGIPLGKTVTTEFAIGRSGPTKNPHNTAHTPGGSSSGSAAGTAAGMFAAALGTQTQGSLIRPASFCGVVGYKPSLGALSTDGVHPLSRTHDHLGVLAGSVTDAWWLARWISEWAPGQGHSGLAGPIAGVPPACAPYRLAVLRTRGFEELSEADERMFEATVDRLRQYGVTAVEPADDPQLRALADRLAYVPEQSVEMLSYEMRWPFMGYVALSPELIGPRIHDLMARARGISRTRYQELLGSRDELRRFWASMASRYDGFVLPSSSGPAPAGLEFTGSRTLPVYGSFLGIPAYGLPVMASGDLPFGLQLAGFADADYRLTCHAQWVVKVLGGPQNSTGRRPA